MEAISRKQLSPVDEEEGVDEEELGSSEVVDEENAEIAHVRPRS